MAASPSMLAPALRLGGACAIIGASGYLVAGALHGDLPSGVENALPHVAGMDGWQLIHLFAIFAVTLWPVAFVGLALSMRTPWGALLGRLALGVAVIGFTVYIIDIALDGYVLKVVADDWAAASGAPQEERYLVAQAVYRVLQGTFVSSIMWLTGLPFLVMGAAIVADIAYPRWLGWAAAIGGGFVAFSGMTYYLGLEGIPHVVGFVIPGALLMVWLITMGVLMLRRSAGAGKVADAEDRPLTNVE